MPIAEHGKRKYEINSAIWQMIIKTAENNHQLLFQMDEIWCFPHLANEKQMILFGNIFWPVYLSNKLFENKDEDFMFGN